MKNTTHRTPLKPLATGLSLLALSLAFAPLAHAATTGSATANLDTRDYTLAVTSAHGTPVPAAGTHTYAWHAAVTASVDAASGGYTCTGWSGSGAIPASGTTNTTRAITLTTLASSIAWQWQADATTHLITLHPGDHGSIANPNSGVNYVTNVVDGAAFPAVTVNTVAGYTHSGWNPTLPATVDAAFASTAQYTANSYTVTFDAQSGVAASPATKAVTFGGAYGMLATTTRAGYTFAGWYTGAGGTGTEVTAATVVTTASAHMLYAKWTINQHTLTVASPHGTPVPAVGVHTYPWSMGSRWQSRWSISPAISAPAGAARAACLQSAPPPTSASSSPTTAPSLGTGPQTTGS